MEEITKENALEIAHQHLAKQLHGELNFFENPPDAYGLEKPEDCYCFHVSDSPVLRIGSGRMICILKATGEIMFDGLLSMNE